MKAVEYTTEDGYKQVRGVPDNAGEDTYHMGVIIGPPELGSLDQLGLESSTIRDISNSFADAGFLNFDSIRGKRRAMQTLIGRYVADSSLTKAVRKRVTAIYQSDLID